MKRNYFICLIFLILIISSCSKSPNSKKRKVFVSSSRYGKVAMTVQKCIELRIVTEEMTIEECNKAVKGNFILKTKLENDWAIYSYKDENEEQNLFCKGNIVKNKDILQKERFRNLVEKLKEEAEKEYIRKHTSPPE